MCWNEAAFGVIVEHAKAGRYGLVLDCALGEAHPVEALKRALGKLRGPVTVFGRREGPFRFLRAQLAMQFRKQGN